MSGKYKPKVVSSTVDFILSTLLPKMKVKTKDLVILDIGCGTGEYAFEFAKRVKRVTGVEPYLKTYKEAQKEKNRNGANNVSFRNCLIEDFTSKQKFDLAVSLTTIEHMPNAEKSFSKVFKLLKKGGFLFITAPNRLWPLEPHYKLLFLSWLPLPLANKYVRFMRRGTSFEDSAYARTYWGMKKLLSKFSSRYEFVVPDNPHAAFLGIGYGGKLYQITKNVGIFLIRRLPLFWIFSKGFILIVKNQR